jgi:hypothetical protein
MIRNVKNFEEFKKEFISGQRVDFYKNLRIVNELHKEALKLDIFKKGTLDGIETDLKIAKVINNVRDTA